jgi:hypothetical protein
MGEDETVQILGVDEMEETLVQEFLELEPGQLGHPEEPHDGA